MGYQNAANSKYSRPAQFSNSEISGNPTMMVSNDHHVRVTFDREATTGG